MKKHLLLFVSLLFSVFSILSAQQEKDLGRMTIYENHFYNEILRTLNSESKAGKEVFQAIPANVNIPASIDEFETIWKMMPVSQGRTGTCWDYSASSFFESEIFRITGNGVKLSEMFTVYNEYISKAEEFVQTKGASYFAEGSEANAVTRQMKKHGLMPLSVYSGNRMGTTFPDHELMVEDMLTLLNSYKSRNLWDKELIIGGIKTILNHYLGKPPAEFTYKGIKHTPKSFMKEVCMLDPADYVDFMSLKSETYWSKAEYKVPDNYWHSKEYYNVPLDVFMQIIKKSLKDGYSLAIGGDVSEAGYLAQYDVAFVPSFDIPSDYIDENARMMRFFNKSTTDDHGVHLVGFKEGENEEDKWWFLIKDSSSSSFNGRHKGYYFYHEDYIKLKMMNITVHKDVVREFLDKF